MLGQGRGRGGDPLFSGVINSVKAPAKRSNILVQHGVCHTNHSGLKGQTMFDQTSDKVNPHNASCVLQLKITT